MHQEGMRAKRTFNSIIAVLFLAGGWLWAGARLMMDWAGRATVMEDLEHAQGLFARGAEWLFSTPPWVPGALATILTVAVIVYLFRTEKDRVGSKPTEAKTTILEQERSDEVQPPHLTVGSAGSGLAAPESAERPVEPGYAAEADQYEEITAEHSDLTVFVTDYALPACMAQVHLQEMIIKHSYVNDVLARLAVQCIMRSDELREVGERYDYLTMHLCSSPMSYVPLSQLKNCILFIDKNYEKLCAQADQLAEGAGLDCQTHHALAPLWEEWRQCHNRLVDAYRSIKRDLRFAPELYRPGIDGPWTKEIPPINPA